MRSHRTKKKKINKGKLFFGANALIETRGNSHGK